MITLSPGCTSRAAAPLRQIVPDPRSPSMQKTLNLKVKFRESIRLQGLREIGGKGGGG